MIQESVPHSAETELLEPHSIEAEEAVLGAILMEPHVLHDVLGILRAEMFFLIRHGWIYAALLALRERGIEPDNLLLAEELASRNSPTGARQLDDAGGPAYLTYLLNNCGDVHHATVYAQMVFRAYARRRWLKAAKSLAGHAISSDLDLSGVLAEIQREYQAAVQDTSDAETVNGTRLMHEVLANFEEYTSNPMYVRGLKSHIPDIDERLVGFRPGLYAIGGAPGMGKSTLAAGLVRAFAEQAPGVLVPTEMRGVNQLEKMTCDLCGITYKHFLRGYLSQDESARFLEAYAQVSRAASNVTILDTVRPTALMIEAEVLRSGAKWLVVDSGTAMSYQATSPKVKNLYETTTALCQAFQNIARQGIVVLVLWQVTARNLTDRRDKRPTLNDFKQSGAIEETADVCIALYRHDYYVKRSMAEPAPDRYPPNTAQLLFLKDRAGGDGDDYVTVGFVPGKGLFKIEVPE